MSRRVCLVVPDAGPLISLGRGGALDLLLTLGLPIVVVDQVEHEVVRDSRFPDALAARRFIADNPTIVTVFPTFVGRMARQARESGFVGRQKGLGEAAIAEFLARLDEVIDVEVDGALLLYEDSDVSNRSFTLPKNVHLLSLRALLDGMQDRRLIASADAVWERIKVGGRTPSDDVTDHPGAVAGKPTSW